MQEWRLGHVESQLDEHGQEEAPRVIDRGDPRTVAAAVDQCSALSGVRAGQGDGVGECAASLSLVGCLRGGGRVEHVRVRFTRVDRV